MINYIRKTNKLIFDNKKVNEAITYINEKLFKGKYGKSKETFENLNSLLMDVISSVEVKAVEIEDKRKETEEEAKEYFGEEFIKEFENIRKMCDDKNLLLSIHGTDKDSADKILENGLKYKSANILSTSCIQSTINEQKEYNKYSELLNWPHRQYKNLILIGIPQECMGIYNLEENTGSKPIWRYAESNTNTGWEQKYILDPEFLIGYINVNEREIVHNKKFKTEHTYTDLVHDNDVAHISYNKNELSEELATYVNTEEQVTNDNKVNSIKRLYEIEDELVGTLVNLQNKENGILEEIANPLIDTIRNSINLINESKEYLDTNIIIDEKEKQNEEVIISNNENNQDLDEEWEWPDI